MNKFKALIWKDYHIHKKTLFIPFWIVLGFYALILLSLAVGYFRGDLQFAQFDTEDIIVPSMILFINAILVGLPGFIAVLFTITLSQSALNDDLKRNCELFHRSQPVSYWLRSLSKFTVTIGGNWLVLLIIAVFNYLVANSILAYFGQFSLAASMHGILLSFVYFVKISLLIGSITFLLSAIFKDKAFFTGVGILLGIQFLFIILNALLGWQLPLPLKYISGLFEMGSQFQIQGDPTMIDYDVLVKESWKLTLFNWKTLFQLAVSGILFAISTWLYNIKEVK